MQHDRVVVGVARSYGLSLARKEAAEAGVPETTSCGEPFKAYCVSLGKDPRFRMADWVVNNRPIVYLLSGDESSITSERICSPALSKDAHVSAGVPLQGSAPSQ